MTCRRWWMPRSTPGSRCSTPRTSTATRAVRRPCSAGPSGRRRSEVVIATKFGGDMGGANGPDWGARGSRRYIRIAVEASLRRLGTDWIDLYQLHTPGPEHPDRGDAGRAQRAGRRGQGPLHRLVQPRRLAGRRRRLDRPDRRLRGVHLGAERVLLARPSRRGRARPGARAHRPEPAAVLPAGPRAAHRQVPSRRGGPGRQPAGQAAGSARRRPTSTRSRRWRSSPPSAGHLRCCEWRSADWRRCRRSGR